MIGRCLVLCGLLAACSVEEAGAGADCARSTECAMGLVCIDSVCTDDLSSIADPGEVPMLMPEAGAEPVVPDAGEMVPPAPDAGEMVPPAPDAGEMVPPAPDAGEMVPPAMDADVIVPPVDGG